MNAWAFGTFTLIAAICTAGRLANAALEHWFRERWDERHYAPQLPVRPRRVIDVETRRAPWPGDQGARSLSPEEDRRIMLTSRVSRYPG